LEKIKINFSLEQITTEFARQGNIIKSAGDRQKLKG
jgi:hypothetical protein